MQGSLVPYQPLRVNFAFTRLLPEFDHWFARNDNMSRLVDKNIVIFSILFLFWY